MYIIIYIILLKYDFQFSHTVQMYNIIISLTDALILYRKYTHYFLYHSNILHSPFGRRHKSDQIDVFIYNTVYTVYAYKSPHTHTHTHTHTHMFIHIFYIPISWVRYTRSCFVAADDDLHDLLA
jgi:hypothetical protein